MLIVLAALNDQATAIVAVVALVLGVLFIARGPRSDWVAAPAADDESAAAPPAPAPPAAVKPARAKTRLRPGRRKLGRTTPSVPEPAGEEVPAPMALTAPAPVATPPPVAPEPQSPPLPSLEPVHEPIFKHGTIKLGRDAPAEPQIDAPAAAPPPSARPAPPPEPEPPSPFKQGRIRFRE